MTGTRGPVSNPESVGHRKKPTLAVLADRKRKVPKAPDGLRETTMTDWATFWRSPLANTVEEVDVPVVRRLFRLRDQYEKAMEMAEAAMMVKGSVGQIRVNPLADHALKLEAMMLRLEAELGLTPLARMRLGVAIGEAQQTLDKLNERFSGAKALQVIGEDETGGDQSLS